MARAAHWWILCLSILLAVNVQAQQNDDDANSDIDNQMDGAKTLVQGLALRQALYSGSVHKEDAGGMNLSQAIMEAAKELGATEGTLGFQTGSASGQIFNSNYWVAEGDREGHYHLKQGVSASDAVRDIITSPSSYTIECATASKFLYYIAIIHMIGTARFDKAGASLRIGGGQYESILGQVMSQLYPEFPGIAAQDFIQHLGPGEAVYIINPAPTPSGRTAGWTGENMVYLGGGEADAQGHGLQTGKFFAHGNSQATETAGEIQNLIMNGRPGDSAYWNPNATPDDPNPTNRTQFKIAKGTKPWFTNESSHPIVGEIQKLGN